MEYGDILLKLSRENNASVTEIENEMQKALKAAGINCSPEGFIEIIKNEFIKATAMD